MAKKSRGIPHSGKDNRNDPQFQGEATGEVLDALDFNSPGAANEAFGNDVKRPWSFGLGYEMLENPSESIRKAPFDPYPWDNDVAVRGSAKRKK